MDTHYRVVIFGSARIREGDPAYRDIYEIAKGLAKFGFDIVTGGGPGIMHAANAGHKSILTEVHSIGLRITLPFEQEINKYLDIKKDFDRFSSRLDAFASLSDVIIVAPGGIGTLLEFFYSWQLIQVHHMCETPIILYGDMWDTLVIWLKTEVLGKDLINSTDLKNIFHITSVEQVLSFIKKVHEDRSHMEHICANYAKYHVEFEQASG